MNIVWEKIVFKNLMSYGDSETTFYFNKSPTTLITGRNGSGKCVKKNTEITINFKDDAVRMAFLEFMSKDNE